MGIVVGNGDFQTPVYRKAADKVSVCALTDVLCIFHDLQVMVVNSIMFIQCLGLILNSNELLIFL